ncbi:hypothetical protein LguiA_001159 [Lonicera macranthoides]
MSNLFDEIIEEILTRLPAKSLVRFNLVCKKWLSLISDPNFVRKHLDNVLLDPSNNHCKLIVNSSPKFYSIDYQEPLSSTKHNFPLKSPHGLCILGACNGLLCIGFTNMGGCGHDNSNIILWNPLFKHYKILPQCNSALTSVRLVGFGYDYYLDDYKFARVISNSMGGHKVVIYTLKTNSWKTIRSVPSSKLYFPSRNEGTFVNGSLYWASSDYGAHHYFHQNYDPEFENLIIRFDLTDEKFRVVEVPLNDDIKPKWRIDLVEVKGRLGLFQMKYEFRDFQMWILKEDEKKNVYWTKLMRIPQKYGMYSWPVCFVKSDEVVLSTSGMSRNEDKKLVLYNSKDSRFRKLPNFGVSNWLEEKMYVETLVSLN